MGLLDQLDNLGVATTTAAAAATAAGPSRIRAGAASNLEKRAASRASRSTTSALAVDADDRPRGLHTQAARRAAASNSDSGAPRRADGGRDGTAGRRGRRQAGDAATNDDDGDGNGNGAADEARARDKKPFYEAWTLEALQREAKRFGFKSSRSRSKLLHQLEACWEALHPRSRGDAPPLGPIYDYDDDLADDDDPTAQAAAGAAPSGFDLSADEASMAEPGDLTMTLAREAQQPSDSQASSASGATTIDTETRGRRRTSGVGRDRGSDDGEESEDGDDGATRSDDEEGDVEASERIPEDVGASIARALRADDELYRRVLLYEPVSFDEVASAVRRAGVGGGAVATGTGTGGARRGVLRNKEVLRTWLDRQGICFYTGELTGQRSRY